MMEDTEKDLYSVSSGTLNEGMRLFLYPPVPHKLNLVSNQLQPVSMLKLPGSLLMSPRSFLRVWSSTTRQIAVFVGWFINVYLL